MKNKRPALFTSLMAVFLIAGLFGPPAWKASAALAPAQEVEIKWVQTPPSVVCKGDEVVISFAYYSKPREIIVKGTIHASNRGMGTLSENEWATRNFWDWGWEGAKYKAVNVGTDQISLIGRGFDIVAGASTSEFEVIECAYDVKIGASDYVEANEAQIDTQFTGKAETMIDEGGVVYGAGED
jgi:hypothetical protein